MTLRGGLAHHALNLIAAALVLAGLFVCGRGAVLAIGEIGALYQGTADDALAMPEVSEEERSDRLIGHAVSAAWGLAPLAAGSVLFGMSGAIRNRSRAVSLDERGVLRD